MHHISQLRMVAEHGGPRQLRPNETYMMNSNYRQRQQDEMNLDYGEVTPTGVTYYLKDEDFTQQIKHKEK